MTLSRGLKKPSKQPSIAACNTFHHHMQALALVFGFHRMAQLPIALSAATCGKSHWDPCQSSEYQSPTSLTGHCPTLFILSFWSFPFSPFCSSSLPPHLGGWRFCGFIVSALYLGWIDVVPKPQLDHCIVGLGKMPYFYSVSLSTLQEWKRVWENWQNPRGNGYCRKWWGLSSWDKHLAVISQLV